MYVTNFLYQYFATITGCLSVLAVGMHYGWAAPSLPVLQSPESPIGQITGQQGSLILTVQEYGNIIGALIGALIGDRLGRKAFLLCTIPFVFAGWLLIGLYISFELILVAKFVSGLGAGVVYTILPMYLGEISHPKIRGMLGSLLQVFFVFGQLAINIFGNLISIQVATYVACAVPLLQISTFIFMPESPYYLVMKSKVEEAKKSLHKLNNGFKVEEALKEIVDSNKHESKSEKIGFFEIITDRENRKAVFITFGTRFFQQATGITAINFYVKQIFIDADTGISPSMISIVYFFLQFVMCFVNSALVDKTGRKPLLYLSFLGTAITNGILSIYFYLELGDTSFKYIPVATILIYIIIYNIGLSATPMVLFTEFFNTRVKAMAMGFGDLYFSVLIILSSLFFQNATDFFGIYVPFLAFSLFSVMGLFFVYVFIPETKGMPLEEIQRYLKGQK